MLSSVSSTKNAPIARRIAKRIGERLTRDAAVVIECHAQQAHRAERVPDRLLIRDLVGDHQGGRLVAITVGVAICLGSASPMLLSPILFLVLDRRFVRREERFLQLALGTAYEEYSSRVRRWL